MNRRDIPLLRQCAVALFCTLILCVTAGCGGQEGWTNVLGDTPSGGRSAAEGGDPSQRDGDSREEDTGETTPAALPALPDLDSMAIPDLPFDPDLFWSTQLPFTYEATIPGDDFLQAVAGTDDALFGESKNKKNSIEVNGYLVYHTMDSPMGPSKIVVESPHGDAQNILQSSTCIMSICFADKTNLTVEVVDSVHFEGYSATYYTLDLTTGGLSLSPYGTSGSGYAIGHTLHGGQHYLFEHAKDAMDLGEASGIYLQTGEEEFTVIIEYSTASAFYGDAIYFMERDPRKIYAADLLGQNKTLWRTFDTDVLSFGLEDGKLLYHTEDGSYLENLESGDTISLNGMRIQLHDEEGYYAIDSDSTLHYVIYSGETTPIMSNFQASFQGIRGDWIYFWSARTNDVVINRYFYWKIKLDGSELTLLN